MPHMPGNGAIFGVISEDGLAKTGFPVSLVDRTTGKLVSRQLSDGNGAFAFNGLNQNTNDYQVIGQDEDGETYKNAVIRDRIQPVPGYQGASYWGNWRYAAIQYGVHSFYDGQLAHNYLEDTQSGTVPSYSAGQAPRFRYSPNNSTGTVTKPVMDVSITQGDPSIPATTFDLSTMTAYGMTNPAGTVEIDAFGSPAKTALELVADFSTLSSESGWASFTHSLSHENEDPNTGTNVPHVIGLYYNISGKYLRIQVNNTGDYHLRAEHRVNVGDFSMEEYQGVHHVVASAVFGEALNLYIDGVLAHTFSMVGMSAALRYRNNSAYGRVGGTHIHGEYNQTSSSNQGIHIARGISGKVALLAWYSNALDDVQVLDLHQSLMVGAEPKLTGFAKEVFADHPTFYVRLNEPTGTTFVRDMLRGHTSDVFAGRVYGETLMLQPSIVVGGNTFGFNGSSSVRFNYSSPSLYNSQGFTVLCVLKPELETPAATETLLRCTNTSEAYNHGVILQRLVNGCLGLIYRAGGLNEQIDFTVPIGTESMCLAAIAIDKVALTASLFINGELAEQQVIVGSYIDRPPSRVSNAMYYQAMIGGITSDTGGITSPYRGLLGELAVLQNPITAQRAKQIFDATQVV
ncbi:hypothetical protein DARTUKUTA_49 [Bacillus phage vB_BspP_Dartukuta]|nr:hypothetical protein DARTUKUTA_49 [Bacillus phage vB_BspP_Dartukuta]